MIEMNNFKAEEAELVAEMKLAAERVIDSGWYILGSEGAAFEKEWADKCKTTYAVGVANGMDAIEIGLRSLGIGKEDEVITTSMTAFATVLAIHRAGATPVLADIDPGTALLSMDSVARCVTRKTKAVILVHLYGQVRDMQKWVDFCRDNHLVLIEDCAQAHMASSAGKYAGSFGQLGAYSFYPTKNLGALGDAGMLVTDSTEVYESAQIIRNYGQSVRYTHTHLGMNSRLDEMQAAILRVRNKWLHKFTSRRQEIAATYQRDIANPLIRQLSAPRQQENHVYHLYAILCNRRDELLAHLKANGILALIHYPIPVHHQLPMADARRDPAGLPACESHAMSCLSIPCHPQLSDSEVDKVVMVLNQFR